jgi:hypothetical protein
MESLLVGIAIGDTSCIVGRLLRDNATPATINAAMINAAMINAEIFLVII